MRAFGRRSTAHSGSGCFTAFCGFGLLQGLLEDRGLADLGPHVHADGQQGTGEQERDPPAPGEELLLRQQREQTHHQAAQQRAGRGAGVHERCVEAALLRFGVFQRHQRRPAPFAAHRESLADAQQDQDHRTPGPRTEAPGTRPIRNDAVPMMSIVSTSIFLRPSSVAEVAEDDATQRAGQVAGGEGAEREDDRGELVQSGEEDRRKHQRRGRAVQQEVVELDRAAEIAGENDPTHLSLFVGQLAGGVDDRHVLVPFVGWVHEW